MNATMMTLVGRWLLAALFLVAGIRKAMAVAGTAGYFAKLGFPAAEAMAWLAIVIEIGGALMLIIGWKARWAAVLLAIFTVVATLMAHRFWQFDAAQYGNQLNHFLKNFAIVGGLAFIWAYGPGRASVDRA